MPDWRTDPHKDAFKKFDLCGDEGKKNWRMFQKKIDKNHMHPAAAAKEVGTVGGSRDMGYKLLQGTKNQYQIRLNSSGSRATFEVYEATKEVRIRQVGGHT